MRLALLLLSFLPGLWIYIVVFGWIVSGDIAVGGLRIKREEKPLGFWLCIVLLFFICLAIFGVALIFYLGIL